MRGVSAWLAASAAFFILLGAALILSVPALPSDEFGIRAAMNTFIGLVLLLGGAVIGGIVLVRWFFFSDRIDR